MSDEAEKVVCPCCRQNYLDRMHHVAAPGFAFWMCYECDSVWIDIEGARAGGRGRITFSNLYGSHGWSLIEEKFIVRSEEFGSL